MVVSVQAALTGLIEVKIKPIPIGDILRQLHLYLEWFSGGVGRADTLGAEQWEQWATKDVPDRFNPYEHNPKCRNPECPWMYFESEERKAQKKIDQITPRLKTILVTAWPLSKEDAESLQKEGISHVKLGSGFEDYVKHRKVVQPEDLAESLEI